MADTKEAELEITLETYDKHHVKVPKSIATRSAIINMMIEGEAFSAPSCVQRAAPRALPCHLRFIDSRHSLLGWA